MNKNFLSFELSKKLKELGFNELCFGKFIKKGKFQMSTLGGGFNYNDGAYGNITSAPLFSQAFDFLKQKFNISGSTSITSSGKYCFHIYVYKGITGWEMFPGFNYGIDSEFEAKSECIKDIIKIINGN